MSASTRRAGILGGVKVRGVTIRPTTDYAELKNKPTLNGVTIEGDKTAEDYGIHGGGGGGTTYAFAEGDVNGAFSVTPAGGHPQSVRVHGLQDHCFEEALTDEEILTILNHEDDAE